MTFPFIPRTFRRKPLVVSVPLLRETTRERLGPAFDFLDWLDEDETLGVSVYVLGY